MICLLEIPSFSTDLEQQLLNLVVKTSALSQHVDQLLNQGPVEFHLTLISFLYDLAYTL